MFNLSKKKVIPIQADTLENLAKGITDFISNNNEEVNIAIQHLTEYILHEQARSIALIKILSERLGFDEIEIHKKVDEIINSKGEEIKQKIKDLFDISNQINDIFKEKDKNG